MTTQSPRISIITVVYNAKDALEKTLLSILDQDYLDKELIVVDGGSTDGTLNVIKRYAEHIKSHVSEPDNGIYHAMNKGMALAEGQYYHFLNSGDTYCYSNSLSLASQVISCTSHNLFKFQYRMGRVYTERMSYYFLFRHTFNHQSIIYHNSLFAAHNYDEDISLAADYGHLLRTFDQLHIGYFDFALIDFDANFSATRRKNVSVIWRERFISIWRSRSLGAKFKYPALFFSYTMYLFRKIIY